MDTQKTVLEILATGMTQQQLADAVPCSQSTINHLKSGLRGGHTTFEIGAALLAIHKRVTRNAARRAKAKPAESRAQ